MTPREYCTERAAPAGSSLYYALLFHPAAERRALHACFAFLEELRPNLADCTDPTPGGRRLLWWREELEAGRMAESPHPLMVELRALPITRAEILGALEPSVVSALTELAGWQPESDCDWQSHCHALHAGIWQLGTRVCNATAAAGTIDLSGALAALSGQLQQMLELAPRTAAGRCPLPRTFLHDHQLDTTPGAELLSNPRLPAAIREKISALRAALIRCAPQGTVAFKSLPAFCRVLHRINLALCEKLLHGPERLLTERVALTPLRKLWIAWREREA